MIQPPTAKSRLYVIFVNFQNVKHNNTPKKDMMIPTGNHQTEQWTFYFITEASGYITSLILSELEALRC